MSRYTDWRDEYASRQKSASQAMELIKENDLVAVTILAPSVLTAAFNERAKSLGRVDIRGLAPREPELYGAGRAEGRERRSRSSSAMACGPRTTRKIATYLPNTFMLGMKAFDAGRPEARMPDVFITPCSAPNEAGFVHFGAHMWQRKSYAKRCPITIAAVDPNMGPVHGDVWMHVSEIHTFVVGAIQKVDIAVIEERVNTMSPPENRAGAAGHPAARERRTARAGGGPVPRDAARRCCRMALGDVAIDPEAQAIADNIRQLIRDGDTHPGGRRASRVR